MPLEPPNLDDRDFDQLMEEARRRAEQTASEWTDLSPANPGMTLVELFAHLTETMIYRLNRVPEKVYVEFLRLIGVHLHPSTAASALLLFRRSGEEERRLEIPEGTRVAASRSGGESPPVFATEKRAVIGPGDQETEVRAYHGTRVEGEIVGVGTGVPGLSVEVEHTPIVAPISEGTSLMIGVEARPDELSDQAPVVQHRGTPFRVWEEVESFADLAPDRPAYMADRASGLITFAPAVRIKQGDALSQRPQALAAVPPAGREIRAWYRHGGGPAGNVPADTLTVLKDAIQGVEVTNPAPATGGRAAESLENALERGPQELHSLNRAVTARDFELVAQYSSQDIDRAKAITQAALWEHGQRGAVSVLLVPRPREEDRGTPAVTPARLHELEAESVRTQVRQALNDRRPLGTTCLVQWARYKTVRVSARVVVHPEEDPQAIKRRVEERLYQTISPVSTEARSSGWPFGQTIRASRIYEIALEEPGVLWADQVEFQIDEVPDQDVSSIAVDHFQPATWYAGCGSILYRSLNDGGGWEPAGRFPGEAITQVQAHSDVPGRLAVVAKNRGEEQWHIHASEDCGETWASTVPSFDFEVEDLAWTEREETPVLLLATDEGLYELALRPDSSPVPVLVDSQNQDLGFYAVVASRRLRGPAEVAVAAQETEGVYLSSDAGQANTFRHIGLEGTDVRILTVQREGPRSFLWAGAAAFGDQPGKGCFRWELLGGENPPDGWQAYGSNWEGGSCLSLAFLDGTVLAGTYRSGVLRLDLGPSSPAWNVPDAQSGLPLRETGDFQPVKTVAARSEAGLIMAGGSNGIVQSTDVGATYDPSPSQASTEQVTLPDTWLFCSGNHELTVVTEDEAERN